MNIPFLSARVGVLFLLAFGAACSSASATGAPNASVDPANAELIGQAYQSYVRRDARDVARQAALLPKDHLLRPWAQAWAALADPAADPGALLAFAKKFPYSLMRWRLLEESAVRLAKAGSLDKAKLALASIPERALGPQGRCAATLVDPSRGAGRGVELLAQGSASDICSKASSAALGPNADGFGAAFARMLPEQARQAAAGSSLSANPSAVAGISAWSELMERPRWDPALPLTSKEALARHIASALGSGKCQTTPLYEPGHLTERGQANAARCALWNHSIPQAIAYWEALSNAKPDEARWRAMLAIARGSPASSGFASTSYFQLLSNVAWGARAPGAEPASPDAKPTVSAGPAATCQDGGAELALSLWAHGVRKESADAWRELLERSDTATRACLGQRADALGAHALRIAAFAGSTYDERAYKPGFEKIIASAAERQGLDVDLWSSVARQESRYDETAMSRSGALGLFQMMPVTAREVALQAKVEPLSSASLLQAQPNAELAAYHFSKLLAQFKDDVPWSLCAYNAGPGRCKGWRSALSDLPMALRIEAIPYDETRVYIERILAGWSLSSSPDPRRASFLADGLPKAKADSPSAAPTIKKIKKLRHSKVKISH